MEVPLNHNPFTEGICTYEPTILGYPHDYGNPHTIQLLADYPIIHNIKSQY